MNNLSDWIVERQQAYHAAGDEQRYFLADGWNRAFKFRETDPDQAIQLFYEARQLAEQLEEPWWIMTADHWRLAAMMHFKKDYRQVVELAVQNVVMAAKSERRGVSRQTHDLQRSRRRLLRRRSGRLCR